MSRNFPGFTPKHQMTRRRTGCFFLNGGLNFCSCVFWAPRSLPGPQIVARSSSEAKMGGLDAENHEESDTRAPNYIVYSTKHQKHTSSKKTNYLTKKQLIEHPSPRSRFTCTTRHARRADVRRATLTPAPPPPADAGADA